MSRPTIVYHTAASLDGFVADPDGGVDWLSAVDQEGVAEGEQEDHGYHAFYDSIEALVMGRRTYDFVVGAVEEWPYPGKPAHVLTSRAITSPWKEVVVSSATPAATVAALGAEGHGRLWLVGGGELAGSFLRAGLVDELHVTWIPVTIGRGRPLFGDEGARGSFELVSSKAYPTGAVAVRYCRK